MSYHGEYWCNAANSCVNANSLGNPNFYSSLGLAYSSNAWAPYTFTKMGEVAEPYVSHEYIFSNNENLEIGGGAMIIGDANGNYIPNFAALADRHSICIYLHLFLIWIFQIRLHRAMLPNVLALLELLTIPL